MANEVKLVLIGGGNMGQGLADAATKIEGVTLAGVYDPAPASRDAASAKLGAPAFDDLDKMLKGAGARGAIVASPPFVHRANAEAAAAAGLHVFCEKPIAATVADGRAIIDAAKVAGVHLMVGQVLRYHPAYAFLKKAIESGKYGRVLSVFICRLSARAGTAWAATWRGKLALCGGLLEEVNAHELDMLCYLCGEPVSVTSQLDNLATKEMDYEDEAMVIVRFRSGALGYLHSSQCAKIGRSYARVHLSEGALEVPNTWAPEFSVAGSDGKAEKVVEAPPADSPVVQEMRAFVEAIRGNCPVAVPGEDGLRAVRIADAARRSSAEGRTIVL